MISVVSTIHKAYWDGKLPVDVFAIARSLEIEVKRAVLPATVFARIVRKEGNLSILLNEADSVERSYYCVAHCLGRIHYQFMQDAEIDLGPTDVSYGNIATRPANYYALDLLIPMEVLRWLVLNKGMTSLGSLAKQFFVSEVAMKLQLERSGLLTFD